MKLLKLIYKLAAVRKIVFERLPESLHLNLFSLSILIFGGFRFKLAFDLIFRQGSAFGILEVAEISTSYGIKNTVIEFGVGEGDRLLKMRTIPEKVTSIAGIQI